MADTRHSTVRRATPHPVVFALMVVAVLLSTGALLSIRSPTNPLEVGAVEHSGDSVNQAIWGLMYVSSGALLAASGRIASVLRRVPVVTWVLLAIAVASPLWSADPPTSIRRLLALGGSTVVGLYLGANVDRRTLLRISAWAAAVAVVLSLVAGLAFPSIGIAQDVRGPMWRGVFSHKSTLGVIMSWSIGVTLLAAATRRGVARGAWVAVAVGAAVLLVLSGSRTGAIVLPAAALGTLALIRTARLPRTLGLGIIFVTVPVLVTLTLALFLNLDAVTGALGRDVTLTGRSTIWEAVWPSIMHQPWLGYGYDAFWGGPSSPARAVWARLGIGLGVTEFRPSSAHDAWLNLWLQLGVGAVVTFAITLAIAIRRAVRAARVDRGPATAAPVLFLLVYLCFTTVEGAMLTPNSVFWVLLVAYLVQPEPMEIVAVTSDPS